MDSEGGSGRWYEPGDTVKVAVTLNGENQVLETEPRKTLADTLRAAGHTGTHLGCEHGVCGSCTVLVDGRPVRSCLMLAVQVEGRHVETVEGLAFGDELHPIQRAFHEGGALQCGFCTPGFLMLATGVLREDPRADAELICERMTSNVCRCTGGVPITAAVLAAQRRAQGVEE